MNLRVRALSLSFVVASASTVGAKAAAGGPSADVCATASDDAQPLRKAGKLREAKQRLLVCVNGRCPSVVRSDCTVQLNEVEQVMPSVVFGAKDARGADVAAVLVTMDGAKLADHLDGTSLPVDPGQHRFVFEMAGAPPLTRDLLIREGEKDRQESIVFGAPPTSGPATASAGGRSTWPVYAAFGVGGAGIVVGSIFGVLALHTKSTLDSECPSKTGCPPADVSALSTRGWIANAGFAAGIVGAGVGAILLLTSGGSDRPSVGIQAGPMSIGLVGSLP
jgi:hypothetical protein